MTRALAFLAVVLSTASLGAQSVPPRFTLDHERIAAKVIERLDMKEGETFLALAHPGLFDELIPHLRYHAMRAGAVDLGVMDVLQQPVPESWSEETLAEGGTRARERLRELLSDVDAFIMLPGANPGQPAYAAIQDILRAGRGRTIHFHWLQNGSAFPLPGQPLPPRHEIERVYQRALLETDYEALAARQRSFVSAMRGATIRVTDPRGTDLTFRIGERPVNVQDGDASKAHTDEGVVLIDREIELPAGAIRVAPVEDSVEGTIAFPTSRWGGRAVRGLTLEISRGKVTSVTADEGESFARSEIEGRAPSSDSFREFALGFNPLLAVPEEDSWIPYYGYGSGVVRLSLGDNSELGGTVGGGYVRWNFFVDTTVTVDGEVWVRDGRLLR